MNIAIVDDQKEERDQIQGFLEDYGKERGIAFEIIQNESGINFISDYKRPFDIIFMDIDMPNMNGMEVAKKLRTVDSNAVLFFCTRMSQYAIQGYEVDAMDFMVKPISKINLYIKMDKAVRKVKSQRSRFSINANGEMVMLSASEVYYTEGSNQYVIFHTVSGNYKVHTTLKKTEELLGTGFTRCSNSFIVNISYIDKISNLEVTVNGDKLPISRSCKKKFLNDVNLFIGV